MAQIYKVNGRHFSIGIKTVAGKKYYRLRWRIDGINYEKTYKSLDDAKRYARAVSHDLISDSCHLEPEDALVWQLMNKQKPNGVTVWQVFTEGLKVIEEKEKWRLAPDTKADEVVRLYMEQKKGADSYRKALGIMLNQFADSFQCKFHDISADEVQFWLDNYDRAQKTKYQISGYLKTFFCWAQSKGYYPDTRQLSWTIEKPIGSEVEVYTVEECERLLRNMPANVLPAIAIQMFSGLRSIEVARLDWTEVRDDGIVVMAKNSKTKRRRVAPMLPVLKEWCRHFGWPISGPVIKLRKPDIIGNYFFNLARYRDVTWRKNGLRHSWCSYRLAATKNAAATAYEAGHSVAIQQSSYEAVVPGKDAARYFALTPEKVLG